MRAIPKPSTETSDVFNLCIATIQDTNLKTRLTSIAQEIVSLAEQYNSLAESKMLYSMPSFIGTNDDELIIGEVTNRELKKLYSQHMVGASKPARIIYDQLRNSAPNDICPFCGFSNVETLDHLLPQKHFPSLSIIPLNLIPACSDCNRKKREIVPQTEEEQNIHPYFDFNLISDQWLFAELDTSNSPIRFRYYVQSPNDWSTVSKSRVEKHFDTFDLAKRFTVQAGAELPNLNLEFTSNPYCNDANIIRALLDERVAARLRNHKNSWQLAMFQALAISDWYCEGGFLNII